MLRQTRLPELDRRRDVLLSIWAKSAAGGRATRRAKLQYQQAQAQIRALELTVATEVTNAALQVESTLKRLDAARAARQLSEKRLENEQSKFEVGMSTNFFVVQAQRDLLDSQNIELRAALDHQKALVAFDRVQLTSGHRRLMAPARFAAVRSHWGRWET